MDRSCRNQRVVADARRRLRTGWECEHAPERQALLDDHGQEAQALAPHDYLGWRPPLPAQTRRQLSLRGRYGSIQDLLRTGRLGNAQRHRRLLDVLRVTKTWEAVHNAASLFRFLAYCSSGIRLSFGWLRKNVLSFGALMGAYGRGRCEKSRQSAAGEVARASAAES